jgi:hypothetical protein
MNRFIARLLAVLLLLSPFSALAQERSFTIASLNSIYTANVTKKPDKTFLIEVFDKRTGNFEWESWAEWDDKKKAFLSNDGKFFVAINPYYIEDENVIEIYHDGMPILFNGKVLKIQQKNLRRDSGKYIWIHMSIDPLRFNYSAKGKTESLELDIIDGRTIIIPLK